jgi:hypothetical protein
MKELIRSGSVFNGFYTAQEPFESEQKIVLNFTRHNSDFLSNFDNFKIIDIPITIKTETINPHIKLADLIISKLNDLSLKPDFLPFIILPNHTRLNLPIYLTVAGLFDKRFPVVMYIKQNQLRPNEMNLEWLVPSTITEQVKSRRPINNNNVAIEI